MEKKAKSKRSKRKPMESIGKPRIIVAAIILIALILLIIFYDDLLPKKSNVLAVVNGEPITEEEFNMLYSQVPELYKSMGMTEEKFLSENLIPQKLLLQEAGKRGINATDQEVDEMISNVMEMNGVSQEEFEKQLDQQNVTFEGFKELTREQLIITKLMNETVSEINITDDEVRTFYYSNKELFATGNETYLQLWEVKDKIKSYLANNRFMDQLKENADIQILVGGSDLSDAGSGAAQPAAGASFMESSEELCTEDGKPLVILFSTTTCPHCKWIKKTFDSFALEYADKISAYHWEMDTGDNTLTSETESKIPDQHLKLFWKYSPQGGVPTFVFGCKYYRVGNAYESTDDLDAEAEEFRTVADSLAATG